MEKKRIEYIDLLRGAGALAVVLFHTTMPNQFTEHFVCFLFGWCVPIFLMITGALFLNSKREVTMQKMLKKNVLRMLGVLLVWGFIYNIITNFLVERDALLPLILKSLKMVAVADTSYCYQFWYIYMLVGLYILIPIIKPWTDKFMEKQNSECNTVFAVLLLLSVVLPSVLSAFGYSETIWSGAFTVFSGFAFYLLCGCYMSKWDLNKKIRGVIIGVFALFFVIILVLLIAGRYNLAYALSEYVSLATLSLTILVFDLAKHINFEKISPFIKKVIKGLGADSFGIYIFHVMFLMIFSKAFELLNIGLNPWLFSILQFLFAVICSVIATRIVKKIPGLKKLV